MKLTREEVAACKTLEHAQLCEDELEAMQWGERT